MSKVLLTGSNDTSCVPSSTRVIAIDTPNDNSINTTWGTYGTTDDAIEVTTTIFQWRKHL